MRFGLNFPNFGDFADVRLVTEVASTAEQNGWDGVFIWDHISRSSSYEPGLPTADVTVALTAIALATERVTFGPLVTPLARRRPHKVAREFATLDHLSNGRVILGVGLGAPTDAEFEAFGENPDPKVRADLLDEALEIITKLWSGERVDFDGERHHIHTEPFRPTPVQQPRVPIWVAASWPGAARPIRRAARWDGIFPLPLDRTGGPLEPDDIDAIRQQMGNDDKEIVIEATDKASAKEYERAGATWWLDVVTDGDSALEKARHGPETG